MSKKINPDSAKWRQMAYELALSYCPTIYACTHCGAPVIKGYCCTHCGSTSPGK